MKARTFIVFALFCAIDLYLGMATPWWSLVIPAFLAGWLLKFSVLHVAPVAALIAWSTKSLYHDLPTGFRLSSRIAGILSLEGFIFAYLVMGLLVTVCVYLAVISGRSLRTALFARTLPRA